MESRNIDTSKIVTINELNQFDVFCQNLAQSSTDKIIRNLSDLLAKDPRLLFRTIIVEDLNGYKYHKNLITYAKYSYNPSLLKALASYAKADPNVSTWVKFVEAMLSSKTMPLDAYYKTCNQIINIQKRFHYNDESIAADEKEQLLQLRKRLPLSLQQDQVSLFDPNNRKPIDSALEVEISLIKETAEAKSQEIYEFESNPEVDPFVKKEYRNTRKPCKPYREDSRAASNNNDNNRSTEEQLLALCKPETRQYILNRKKEKPLNTQFEELNATESEIKLYARNMNSYEDPVTMEIINIPLIYQGVAFEWTSILAYFTRQGNKFIPPNPHSHRAFEIKDLDPGFIVETQIQFMIDTIKAVREEKENERVKDILEKLDPNNAGSVLIEACNSDNIALVQAYLNKFKSQPDKVNLARSPEENPAIVCAILNDHDKVLDALLKFPNIDLSHCWNNFNLLMISVNKSSKKCYDLLINKFDVNAQSQGKGYTALMIALLSTSNIDIIRHLLSIPGLNLAITDATGRTAIDIALTSDNSIIRNMIQDALAKRLNTVFTNDPINFAIIDMGMKFYGDRLATSLVNSPEGKIPFIFALIKYAPLELVEKYIPLCKAHLNIKHNDLTLIHFAVMHRSEVSILRCLIREGCTQVNAKTRDFQMTALMMAAKQKSAPKIEVLLKEGKADPNLRNIKNKDALHYVTERQQIVIPKDTNCTELLVNANDRLTLQKVTIFKVMPAIQQMPSAPVLRK